MSRLRHYYIVAHTNGSVRCIRNRTLTLYTRNAGPAVIDPNGMIQYRNLHGRLHRTDGPAVIWPDGRKEYWVNNQQLTVEEFFFKCGMM